MGQYFILVNLDKKEYVMASVLKLWEWCANDDARMIPYLLATSNKDGTNLVSSVEDGKPIPRGWKVVYSYKVSNKKYHLIERETKYYGRWAGDRIVLLGDYAEGIYEGMFERILDEYKDITSELIEEFNEFIGDEDLKIKGFSWMMADIMITK